MQNRSEPCIWDKYPCQSGTDRQKGGRVTHILELAVMRRERCRKGSRTENGVQSDNVAIWRERQEYSRERNKI